jgi:hypothetical protein
MDAGQLQHRRLMAVSERRLGKHSTVTDTERASERPLHAEIPHTVCMQAGTHGLATTRSPGYQPTRRNSYSPTQLCVAPTQCRLRDAPITQGAYAHIQVQATGRMNCSVAHHQGSPERSVSGCFAGDIPSEDALHLEVGQALLEFGGVREELDEVAAIGVLRARLGAVLCTVEQVAPPGAETAVDVSLWYLVKAHRRAAA